MRDVVVLESMMSFSKFVKSRRDRRHLEAKWVLYHANDLSHLTFTSNNSSLLSTLEKSSTIAHFLQNMSDFSG